VPATALKATINGSILADPEACFVMMMALPFGDPGIGNRPGHQSLAAVPWRCQVSTEPTARFSGLADRARPLQVNDQR
jgi:hypothetical protein